MLTSVSSSRILLALVIACLLAFPSGERGLALGTEANAEDAARLERGRILYAQHCASCHGAQGEGVAGEYEEPLYGDRPLEILAGIIHETMPVEEPELVADADAQAVAEFLYQTFYTAEARARNRPPRIELLRLTGQQYGHSVADLLGTFLGQASVPADAERGLSAEYFDGRNFRRENRKMERIDPQVAFSFGAESPAEEIGIEEFSIRWEGTLLVEESGQYEFNIRTENGFRFYLNDSSRPFIDGSVASGAEPSDHTERIMLLGGRVYPLRLDFFKAKDKSASVELRWLPPGGVEELLPQRHLTTRRVPQTFIVSTHFPPDDASTGYVRGRGVSREWGEATTQAAIEVAAFVEKNLNRLAGTRREDEQRLNKIQNFCRRFVERAFRRPLADDELQLYVQSHFAEGQDLETSAKRVVLLSLLSPRFLYPELNSSEPDSYDIASRLALGLWDSLPDGPLLEAAAKGELTHPDKLRAQARRMLQDSRAKAKLRGFFHELLAFDEARGLNKDTEQFPMFDAALLADLRTSLELFLNEIVWSDASDFRELMLSSDMFVNQRMAEVYGIELGETSPGEFQRVSLNADQRAGVITHPFLLSALAYHQSSSPIHRGVFLTRKVLNRSLSPPPMAIEFEDSLFDPALTMREKVAEMTKAQACMTCHNIINPLGFSLENYDAIGRFRTMDKEKPIDASGELTGISGEPFKFQGAREVAQFVADDLLAQKGFIEHLFHHTVKQPVRAYGEETLEELRASFAANRYNIQQLLIEVTLRAALHGVAQPEGKAP